MDSADRIVAKAAAGELCVAVVGLGYVGLPLALAFVEAGARVVGVDIDPEKAKRILAGESYLTTANAGRVAAALATGRLDATTDHAAVARADAVLLAVPTPLGPGRTPDMSFVESTVAAVAPHLAPGALLSLESTVYPGATREAALPLLAAAGRRPGVDVLVTYAPEREDPGNARYAIADIPKVVAGLDDASLRAAEAVKITENVFRAVNIALANELKAVYARMGVDMYEVVDAAATKPFGYMPFYPGPGLGGHCIPIDPFYLAWRARALDVPTRFVELAGEINSAQPEAVVRTLADALSRSAGKALHGARILVLGVAYKPDVNDTRESPGLEIMRLLADAGAAVAFHDPHVRQIGRIRRHPELEGAASVPLDNLEAFDAAIVVTDHTAVDYDRIGARAPLIIDARGVYRNRNVAATVVRA